MTLTLAVVVGYLAARLLWLLLASVFQHPSFQRLNYRERVVPVGAGLILALALLFAEAVRNAAGAAGVGTRAITGPRASVVIACVTFGLLGLLDDVAGSTTDRGLRGHVGALVDSGRLTTGGLKLLGGAAAAAVAVSPLRHKSFGPFLLDAVVVALAANLGNLFDRAPGRTIKVGTGAFVVLAFLNSGDRVLVATAIVVGAALGLFRDDLHERLMLGDAGANVLGAALGVGVVVSTAVATRVVVLIALVAATLASEWISFGRVIDGTRPLRNVDRWGRL